MAGIISDGVAENAGKSGILDNLVAVLSVRWSMPKEDSNECSAYFYDLTEANKIKTIVQNLCSDTSPLSMSAKVENGVRIYKLPIRMANLSEIREKAFENYEGLKEKLDIQKLDSLVQEDYFAFCSQTSVSNQERAR